MTDYVHVDSEGNVDQIGLPPVGERWVDVQVLDEDGEPTGQTERVRASVSGFDALPQKVLAEEGWLPVVGEVPEVGPGEMVVAAGYEVGDGVVTRLFDVVPAPPSLTVVPTQIPADDTTVALATYTDHRQDAPVEAVFTVNGEPVTVGLSEGVAELEVTSGHPGTVTITVGNQTVFVNVVEVASGP